MPVGVIDRAGQYLDQAGRPHRRQRLAGQVAIQAAGGAVLQREVGQALVLADLVDLNDVGVRQPGHGLRLGTEAEQVLAVGPRRADHLQRH